MYFEIEQLIELLNSIQNNSSTTDFLVPIISTLVGGILSILTTLILLNKQNKNNQKKLIIENKINKTEKDIAELKDYYIQFSNYFLAIHNHYKAFPLVISSEMTYDDWFTNDFEQKPYDHTYIELITNLYELENNIQEFYKILDKLNELYLFTDASKYRKGMVLNIDTSKFEELFKSLIEEGSNYKNRILNVIKQKKNELEMIKNPEK